MDQPAVFDQSPPSAPTRSSGSLPFVPIRAVHRAAVCGLTIAGLCLVFSVGPSPARQPHSTETAGRCAAVISSRRTVTAISGPASLRLDDATEIVLAGVLLPDPVDSPSATLNWAPARRAASALEHLAVGRSAELAFTGLRSTDRYGRRHAQVYVHTGGRRIWLQASLVGLGQARVDVAQLSPACADELLRHEADARRSRHGLWANAAYQIRDARDIASLLRYRSTFQIVRGTVYRVARVRSRVFINFGRNWRKDFTAGLTRKIAQRYLQGSRKLTDLEGRQVVIRGWIERRGGPYISVRSPAQIQLIEGPPNSTEPPHRTDPHRRHKKRRPAFDGPDTFDL